MLHQEFAKDVLLIGCRGDRLAKSFCVDKNVYDSYFLAIWLANKGTNHPF